MPGKLIVIPVGAAAISNLRTVRWQIPMRTKNSCTVLPTRAIGGCSTFGKKLKQNESEWDNYTAAILCVYFPILTPGKSSGLKMCQCYIQYAILRQHFTCWHCITVDPGLWNSPLLSSGIIAIDLQLFPTIYYVHCMCNICHCRWRALFSWKFF